MQPDSRSNQASTSSGDSLRCLTVTVTYPFIPSFLFQLQAGCTAGHDMLGLLFHLKRFTGVIFFYGDCLHLKVHLKGYTSLTPLEGMMLTAITDTTCWRKEGNGKIVESKSGRTTGRHAIRKQTHRALLGASHISAAGRSAVECSRVKVLWWRGLTAFLSRCALVVNFLVRPLAL